MSKQGDQRLLALAVALHLEGKRREALELLKPATGSGTACAELYAAMGLLHFELREYEQALDCYSKFAAQAPHQPAALLKQAACLEQLGRWNEALASYETALSIHPEHGEARLRQGACLIHLNRPEQAQAAFESCLKVSPRNSDALLGKAVALQLGGRLEEADGIYAALLAADAHCEPALANRIAIAVQRQDARMMRDHAERLLAMRPDSEVALAALAACALSGEDYERAARHLRELLAINPENTEARFGLGVALQKLARPEKAEEVIRAAPATARIPGYAVQRTSAPGCRQPYPHRSVRSVRFTTPHFVAGLAIAFAISLGLAGGASAILNLHGRVCVALLRLAGVMVDGRQSFQVFAPIQASWAAVVPFFSYSGHESRFAAVCALSIGALVVLYRHVTLARNFLLFVFTLLILPALFLLLGGTLDFTSASFTQTWIRFELVIWFLLPWVSVFRFFPVQRSVFKATASVAAVQGFGFVWSAARLAFCLGLFHYTGVLFLPLMWFCLGLLGDVLYVIVFYSVAVHRACIGLWGERTLWQ